MGPVFKEAQLVWLILAILLLPPAINGCGPNLSSIKADMGPQQHTQPDKASLGASNHQIADSVEAAIAVAQRYTRSARATEISSNCSKRLGVQRDIF
jgi:hypothetical protein